MTRRTNGILTLATCGTLLASALLVGCQLPGAIPAEALEPMELQTYQVPVEYREELGAMLRSALHSEQQPIGRVTYGPGGTILVAAPSRIQAGVREILDRGFDAPPVATPVKLTYWLLVGRPVESASGQPQFSVTGDRRVPRLDSVLSEIASAQGPTEFALLEQLQLTSVSQSRAHLRGKFARITQRATRVADQIVTDVALELDGNGFESQVMLEKNQFVVLGQTGFGRGSDKGFPDAADGETLTLYYVMAADLEP